MNYQDVTQQQTRESIYQEIAGEYYDRIRHPTSWDLGLLSRYIVFSLIQDVFCPAGNIIELGAGKSILAENVQLQRKNASIFLVDNSSKMLLHTKKAAGISFIVANAEATGLPSQSAALIVASLGDPYNGPDLWREISRLLGSSGFCIFTTPSYEWSSQFRDDYNKYAAEFLRSDGCRLLMPSYIYDRKKQTQMIESAGLRVAEIKGLGTNSLDCAPAPKLTCVEPSTPVVSAYVVHKA